MANEPTEPYGPESPPETHLWDYLYVLMRRKRVVLAVFLAVVSLATLRTLGELHHGLTLIRRALLGLAVEQLEEIGSRLQTGTKSITEGCR